MGDYFPKGWRDPDAEDRLRYLFQIADQQYFLCLAGSPEADSDTDPVPVFSSGSDPATVSALDQAPASGSISNLASAPALTPVSDPNQISLESYGLSL